MLTREETRAFIAAGYTHARCMEIAASALVNGQLEVSNQWEDVARSIAGLAHSERAAKSRARREDARSHQLIIGGK